MNDKYLPDLHGLIKAEGEQAVADTLGTTVGQLRQYRAGVNPLTIDHLYRLSIVYGSSWIVGTVIRIGAKRDSR
tara:strand:- start:1626 stop:1847 length:222 start_codon:yes stop_codon:yes gene_type:complete